MVTSDNRFTAYLVLGLAGLIGGGTLLVFMVYLYIGPLKLVNLGLSESTILCLDAFLCLLFFVQHSVMIRKSFLQRLARFLPSEFEAAFYAIVAGFVLLLLLVFWQESSYTIAAPQGILRWLLRAVYFLSLAVFAWGVWSLGKFDPFGIIPILNHLRGTRKPAMPFIVCGPYRLVRHPWYISLILMIWSYPNLTLDRLLFNVLFTAWMVIGTLLEERDLAATFGNDYLAYQQRVPMLIPYRLSLFRKPIEDHD